MKKENTAKFIIVGAGLSGLTSAYQLAKQKETNFFILESRDKIGGRILTKNGIDLGATWFQNYHQNVLDVLDDLALDKFNQYSKGKGVLVYNSTAVPHYFMSDPNAPSAQRISYGSISMIEHLATGIESKIKTSTRVTELIESKDGVTLVTNTGNYYAEKVIITLPPQLASEIIYSPVLSEDLLSAMKNTHTWMGHALKVGLTYKTPFWREKDLSGTLIGQAAPVTELYDHSSSDNSQFSLMGFVNESLRKLSVEERKQTILNYLKIHFGDEIMEFTSYQEKDWSTDQHTSSAQNASYYLTPKYGNPLFSDFHLNGKLLFSGTETSSVYGGYMDGAIYSGIKAAITLLDWEQAHFHPYKKQLDN